MEDLIQQYLFQYKQCPLPSLGLLSIKNGNAVPSHVKNTIAPPVPQIEFSRTEIPADHFTSFIAAQKNVPVSEAVNLLQEYCRSVQNINTYGEAWLEPTGRFYINQDGNLAFEQAELSSAFMPEISALKIMRPNAVHSIRVGDTETTNTEMSEYYNESKAVRKQRWWIAAVILFFIGAAVLFMYFGSNKYNPGFGNAQPVVPKTSPKTYRTGN